MLVSFISQFPACSPFSVGQGVSTIEVRYLIVLTISDGPKKDVFLLMRCTSMVLLINLFLFVKYLPLPARDGQFLLLFVQFSELVDIVRNHSGI